MRRRAGGAYGTRPCESQQNTWAGHLRPSTSTAKGRYNVSSPPPPAAARVERKKSVSAQQALCLLFLSLSSFSSSPLSAFYAFPPTALRRTLRTHGYVLLSSKQGHIAKGNTREKATKGSAENAISFSPKDFPISSFFSLCLSLPFASRLFSPFSTWAIRFPSPLTWSFNRHTCVSSRTGYRGKHTCATLDNVGGKEREKRRKKTLTSRFCFAAVPLCRLSLLCSPFLSLPFASSPASGYPAMPSLMSVDTTHLRVFSLLLCLVLNVSPLTSFTSRHWFLILLVLLSSPNSCVWLRKGA